MTLPQSESPDAVARHLKQAWLFFTLVALIPFFTGFVGPWSAGFFLLFLLALPVIALGLLVGALVIGIRGLKVASKARNSGDRLLSRTAAPVLLVATVIFAWPLLIAGGLAGNFAMLVMQQRHYEAIIAREQAKPHAVSYASDGDVTYSVDPGPPVRVAFNPSGILDNWSGIIYDPTGDVMLADGFDPKTGKFAAPDSITKLFGGDLVDCQHLWGAYYTCSFT